MTDLERWQAFVNQAGLIYTTIESTTSVIFTIRPKDGPKQTGYSNCLVDLEFNVTDGSLSEFGILD